MLTIGTRHGFAPDPVLPQRDVLLDPAAVAAHLGAGDCVIVRAKYRIGESLRVTYRIDGRLLTVRAPARSGSGRSDPALDASWWTFPADRKLTGLADLLDPPADLRALVPGWSTGELVEYAAERSATVRALDAAGRCLGYAKAFAPGTVDVAERVARYRRLARVVAAPTAPGYSIDRNVLVLEPMPGRRWADLTPAELPAALRLLGGAIATVHAAEVDPTLPAFGRLALPRVVNSARLVGLARPDVAAAAARISDRLAAGPPSVGEPVGLHGDCHPKNALLDGDRLTLIDFDQAGLGPAAADIGSLLARLAGDRTGLAEAFLRGYRRVRPLPPEPELRWHTAAALVAERAVRAVNRVHLPGLDRLGDLLAAADHVLTEGVPT